jgi:hypothetical protein
MPVGVLGSLPTWLDLSFVRTASGVLVIASLLLVVVAICTLRSVAARLVIVAMLGAAVFGLMHYRDQLDRCDKQACTCKLLGEDLEGGGCAPSR